MPTDPIEQPPENPGGVGDPHVTTFNGQHLDWHPDTSKTHVFLDHGPVKIHARLRDIPGKPGVTAFSEIFVHYGQHMTRIGLDGVVHCRGEGYDIVTKIFTCLIPEHQPGHPEYTRDEHALTEVSHLDITLPRVPVDVTGAWGTVVDGQDYPLD